MYILTAVKKDALVCYCSTNTRKVLNLLLEKQFDTTETCKVFDYMDCE